MNYFKLSMDMTRQNDIVLHCKNCSSIDLNTFKTGKYYESDDTERIEFYFDKSEGEIWTDYLANDKGWFIVSKSLKLVLQEINSEIQFISIDIYNQDGNCAEVEYYIANIVKVVDALCLDKSDYFESYIEEVGTIYSVSKYGIYENKTENADVFKLDNWQQVPIFVSERFKNAVEKEGVTGMSFQEIAVG